MNPISEPFFNILYMQFSLLMAEGIMCHYSINPLTNGFKRKAKTTIHWVLLTLGGGCGVAGCSVMIAVVKFKMDQIHNRLGKLVAIYMHILHI